MWKKFFSILVIPQGKQQNVHKLKIRLLWFILLVVCFIALILGTVYVYYQVFFTEKNWQEIDSTTRKNALQEEKILQYKRDLLHSFIDLETLESSHRNLLVDSNLTILEAPKPNKKPNKSLTEKARKEGVLMIIENPTRQIVDAQNYLANMIDYLSDLSNPSQSFPYRLPYSGLVMKEFGATENPFFPNLSPVNGLLISGNQKEQVKINNPAIVVDAGVSEETGGFYVELYHGNGTKTRYSNLKKIIYEVGELVPANSLIGEVEDNLITGSPLLYYQVFFFGIPQNPLLNLR